MDRLEILTVFQGGGDGGDYTVAMHLHQALLDEGHRSVLCHVERNRRKDHGYELIKPRALAEGIDIHLTPTFRDLGAFAKANGPFDLTHLHMSEPGIKDLVAYRRHVRGLPVVVTAHAPASDFAAVLSWKYGVAESLCDAIIEPSQYKLDYVRKHSKHPDKLRVISNVARVRQAADRLESRRQLGLPADRPVIAFVGMMQPRKRPMDIIEAVPLWRAAGFNPIVLLAGEGHMRPSIEEAAHEFGNDVQILGYVADPTPVYSAADIFVFPSMDESFGLVLVEAGYYGLTVVSSSLPIMQNELSDLKTFSTFPIGDVQELASQTMRAYQRFTAADLESTRNELIARFGPQTIARKHAELYLEVLTKARKTPIHATTAPA